MSSDDIYFSSEDAKKQLENAKKFLSVINAYVKDNIRE